MVLVRSLRYWKVKIEQKISYRNLVSLDDELSSCFTIGPNWMVAQSSFCTIFSPSDATDVAAKSSVKNEKFTQRNDFFRVVVDQKLHVRTNKVIINPHRHARPFLSIRVPLPSMVCKIGL